MQNFSVIKKFCRFKKEVFVKDHFKQKRYIERCINDLDQGYQLHVYLFFNRSSLIVCRKQKCILTFSSIKFAKLRIRISSVNCKFLFLFYILYNILNY